MEYAESTIRFGGVRLWIRKHLIQFTNLSFKTEANLV